MSPFEICRYDLGDGVVQLEPVGEVDLNVSAALRTAELRAIESPGVTGVIVDLQRVTFMDSVGIWALVDGMKAAAKKGTSYTVINPPHMVKRVLTITGLLGPLSHDDGEAAESGPPPAPDGED
jgi:anti-sigma B factor antagonist